MALTLKYAVRVREPGFSPSEALELARMIDIGVITCDDCSTGYAINKKDRDTIVAALREFANG